MKKCIKCSKEFSLDNFYFRKDKQTHSNSCKECSKQKTRDRYSLRNVSKNAGKKEALRKCTECNEIKSVNDFKMGNNFCWKCNEEKNKIYGNIVKRQLKSLDTVMHEFCRHSVRV